MSYVLKVYSVCPHVQSRMALPVSTCPHVAEHVSSCGGTCVLFSENMCPYAEKHVSPRMKIMCPHGLNHQSIWLLRVVLTIQACVLKVLSVCPHARQHVSSTIIAHVLSHKSSLCYFSVFFHCIWIHTSSFLRLGLLYSNTSRVFTHRLLRFLLGLLRLCDARRFLGFLLFWTHGNTDG